MPTEWRLLGETLLYIKSDDQAPPPANWQQELDCSPLGCHSCASAELVVKKQPALETVRLGKGLRL